MDYIELKIDRPSDPVEEEILIARLADLGFESFAEEEDIEDSQELWNKQISNLKHILGL